MSSKDLTEALRAIMRDQPSSTPLDPMATRGGVAVAKSAAPLGGGGKTSSGGIASPLTEPDAATREYWPGGWKTTDGLFSFPALKVIKMNDANGEAVELRFDEP